MPTNIKLFEGGLMDAWERRGDLLYRVTEFITVQLNTVNLG